MLQTFVYRFLCGHTLLVLSGVIWVKILQRNKTNKLWRVIYLFVCYKELTHTIMEAGESELCSVDQQVQDTVKPVV